MKLAILASRSSIHTVRWANAMVGRGYEVHLITMHPGGDALHKSAHVHQLPIPAPSGYYLNVWNVRRLLQELRPDLLHTHYAGGYGLLGRLSRYHPYLLSVWGREVYDVPQQSFLHKHIIAANLQAADHLCSTSHAMAAQTRRLCSTLPDISVTPFGVDVKHFRPTGEKRDVETLTIGTIKTLQPKYGVDILIAAFAMARNRLTGINAKVASKLRLLIVGDGTERTQLEKQARDLEVDDVTTFSGKVPHDEVSTHLNRLDIYVAPSRLDSESFGVAIIEASACERPVIVSDVGGLPEVVEDGVTGLVVERENVEATAEAMMKLIRNPSLRRSMGAAGRQRVLERYDWEENVSRMERVYEKVGQGKAKLHK